tara:strand:+ start:271 stop:687 length:417 start_codon:yes stop_codon:yes gene_type:complete
LPSDVSALVDQIQVKNPQKESFRLQLINLSPIHCRKIYLQAGTFGQHNFDQMEIGQTTHSIDSKWSEVRLPPATSIEMRISLARFVNTPVTIHHSNPEQRDNRQSKLEIQISIQVMLVSVGKLDIPLMKKKMRLMINK